MHVRIWFKKIKKLVMLFQMPKETGCDFLVFIIIIIIIIIIIVIIFFINFLILFIIVISSL